MESARIGNYEACRKVSSGSFGEVYLGKRVETNGSVCMKKIDRKSPKYNEKDIVREIQAGSKLQHEAIPKLLAHYMTEKTTWLVFDWIEGIDLLELMERRNFEPVMEVEARKLFKQVVVALLYCHKEGIAHRDLKLENLMIEKKSLKLRLIDFGLCETRDPLHCMETVGSVNYCAPEVARKKHGPYSGLLSDVWSLGVILYSLVYARFPYAPVSSGSLMLDLLDPIDWKPSNPNYPVSDDLKDLIKSMLTINPVRRASLESVAEHKWLKCKTIPEDPPMPEMSS